MSRVALHCDTKHKTYNNGTKTRTRAPSPKPLFYKTALLQEPFSAPFLNGLFSKGYSRGKTAHLGIRGNGPLRSENGPLRRGNASLRLMGSFRAPRRGGKRPLKKGPIEEVYDFCFLSTNARTPSHGVRFAIVLLIYLFQGIAIYRVVPSEKALLRSFFILGRGVADKLPSGGYHAKGGYRSYSLAYCGGMGPYVLQICLSPYSRSRTFRANEFGLVSS